MTDHRSSEEPAEHRPGGAAQWAGAAVDAGLADELRVAVDAALGPDADESSGRRPVEILLRFKRAGGRLGDAYETLGSLKDEGVPARDDLVDDLLDGVWGWCPNESWLWRDVVYPHELRWSEAGRDLDVHEQIVRWSKEEGVDWCLLPTGYAFATMSDVERFRARWGELLELLSTR